jgi:hypothetical protein
MKNEIYAEINRLQKDTNEINQRKGHSIFILSETIKCFKCIDTKRSWKDRDNLPWSAMDLRGHYDIIGCSECNNCGWISCSHSNDTKENDIRIFHKDNWNWQERLDQLYQKSMSDSFIQNKVDQLLQKEEHVDIKQIQPPLFEKIEYITKTHTEKSLDVSIEVGTIVKIVESVVEFYFGNMFPILELTKELTLKFSVSESQSYDTNKVIRTQQGNYLGIKTIVETSQDEIKTSLFQKNKKARKYTAVIFVMKPLNEEAEKQAQQAISELSDDIINDILQKFKK